MSSSAKRAPLTTSSLTLHEQSLFLTDAQLQAELNKCEFCEEKPCREACPCHCSPADFIKAMEVGDRAGLRRAAALILSQNPLGGICGMVCPDKFCLAACVHRKLDGAVRIPEVQATIIERAKQQGVMPVLARAPLQGKRVAIIGSGPAGLAAAGVLSQRGHAVTIFEAQSQAGGMCNCIPDFRLDKEVLRSDLAWLLEAGQIQLELDHPIDSGEQLFAEGYQAALVTPGLWSPIQLGLEHEELLLPGLDVLRSPSNHSFTKTVAVIGGGATAFDCAMTALARGAPRVAMFALERLSEMPLSAKEMATLQQNRIDVEGRTRVTGILVEDGRLAGLSTIKVRLLEETGFSLDNLTDIPGSETRRPDITVAILAIGLCPSFLRLDDPRVFYGGDYAEGPTTVVEAAAAGKNAAEQVDAFLRGQKNIPTFSRSPAGQVKSQATIPGYTFRPVPLDTTFFGRPILSPFLLSAAPPTDGLEQMKRAYQAGWAGAIMKTAFDGVPIHIPGEYMFAFDQSTYANCDNVSGHALDRVCREVAQLIRLYPDRLTIASTGGPVTGQDDQDCQQWQHNTKLLEEAGAMGIEYSLSCPQGGDGTEGDIVSQNAALSAKIVEWILSAGQAGVPKLFKLTGAVTSVGVIVKAIKEVFDRYPNKLAGITLANSFPTLAFRPGEKQAWEEGIVVGASGAGILPISNLSLAKVSSLGVTISGNGGPMDYKAAADFLALGAGTVQFCTLVMKHGYGIVDHLHDGLSHLLAERGMGSVGELIGRALPQPIRDFMDLSAKKKISAARPELCLRCGNCHRCPYLAISADEKGFPATAAERCVGCGICALKCFSQAIQMRARTPAEEAALQES